MSLRLVDSEEEREDKAEFYLPQSKSGVLGRESGDPKLTAGIEVGLLPGGDTGPPTTATRMGRGPPRSSQLLRERGQRRQSPHQPPA